MALEEITRLGQMMEAAAAEGDRITIEEVSKLWSITHRFRNTSLEHAMMFIKAMGMEANMVSKQQKKKTKKKKDNNGLAAVTDDAKYKLVSGLQEVLTGDLPNGLDYSHPVVIGACEDLLALYSSLKDYASAAAVGETLLPLIQSDQPARSVSSVRQL